MKRKRHTPEEIIKKLREAAGLIAGGNVVEEAARQIGVSTDLDALASYLTSLTTFQVSPYRNQDGSFTSGAIAGAAHFTSKGCTTCHSGTTLTDSNSTTFVLHNISTQNSTSGQRLGATLTGIDTATLRAVWSTPPYLHRGQAATLPDVFNTTHAPRHHQPCPLP